MEVAGTNVADRWILTPEDQVLVLAKSRANRLGFALLLLFYRTQGRFPNTSAEIDPGAADLVARQLGIVLTSYDGFDTATRTWKRHRAEIRALFGFRESTVADAETLSEWLRDQAAAAGCVPEHLAELLYARCRELLIEPPSADRVRSCRAFRHSCPRGTLLRKYLQSLDTDCPCPAGCAPTARNE